VRTVAWATAWADGANEQFLLSDQYILADFLSATVAYKNLKSLSFFSLSALCPSACPNSVPD
jgi:hypothetical protein